MKRTAGAFLCALACDAVLLAAVFPLARYSLAAAHASQPNPALIATLLCANLVLLLLCLCACGAWIYAFFQSLRATHARVVNEATAISRNTVVSRRTTPAN